MCIHENLKNKYFAIIDFILIFLIAVIHVVFFFYIKETDLQNIFDAFESSPLFDFDISDNCGRYSHLVFHVWEGRKETEYYRSNGKRRSRTKIVDKKEIDRINGHYFCYEYKSYKDLLYNDQIIKKEEECKGDYPKDCGTIDTLEQHLCIKNEENCPLYDVGIIGTDEPINKNHYIYNTNADIYYNDKSYENIDKKIIGKIILNDGQPCYRHNEKLWKKFSSEEASEEHLKCELEIFGETTDNRYQRKGNITYNKLYEIFSSESKEILKGKISNDEYVSLYIREFLGIDKKCDEKTDIKKEDYEKLRNNQNMEKICILVEAIIIFCFLGLVLYMISARCKSCYDFKKSIYDILFGFLVICLLLNLTCIICQSVFIGRIIKYDLAYHCSDEITNEVLRKENLNTKKSIKFTAINLGIDIFYILFNIFWVLIVIVIEKIDDLKYQNYFIKNLGVNYNNKNNSSKNKYNVDEIDKKPVREVIINNGIPITANQYNNQIDNNNIINDNNNINQNIENNYPNSNPALDLGVPPPVEQGYSSNTNIY